MKLQTGVSSKDLATLKEIAELEKFRNDKECVDTNEKNEATEENQKDDIANRITEKILEKASAKWDNCFLKWENCCFKPEKCCVVQAVRKISN